MAAWASETTAGWSFARAWATATRAWCATAWASCVEDLGVSLNLAECCWCSVCWEAEVVTEVFDALVCECEVCVGPCVCLLAEFLGNEGSADLECVDVEAVEFLVCAGLVVGDDKNTVLEEITEDLTADGCWHIHFFRVR